MLFAALLSIYFIQRLIARIISEEQQKVHFRLLVVKTLPRLEANRKKKKRKKIDAQNVTNGTGGSMQKDFGAGERTWVSPGRVPLPERLLLLQGQTWSPPWVPSWLWPAQATPGTPLSQQLGSLQGRGGRTLCFLGSHVHKIDQASPCVGGRRAGAMAGVV